MDLLFRLVNVDASFQHLTLQAEDAAGRQHHLQVFLSTQVIITAFDYFFKWENYKYDLMPYM